jgi:hypothetical protein
MPHLTVSYFTSRKEPKLNWFLWSLSRELGADFTNVRIVIVDLWAQAMDDWTQADVDARMREVGVLAGHLQMPVHQFFHVPPKPNVWNGAHRLTKVNWFAASNARNTAICLAPDGFIAFVDDVSVLRPGWGNAVRRAMDGDGYTITCGA